MGSSDSGNPYDEAGEGFITIGDKVTRITVLVPPFRAYAPKLRTLLSFRWVMSIYTCERPSIEFVVSEASSGRSISIFVAIRVTAYGERLRQ